MSRLCRMSRLRRVRARWWSRWGDHWRVSCLRGLRRRRLLGLRGLRCRRLLELRGLRRLLRILGHVPLVLNLTTFRRSRDGPSECAAALRQQ
jgi:hypothetical protein